MRPAIIFVKDLFNVYVNVVIETPEIRKAPVYVLDTDRNFPFVSRGNIDNDEKMESYHFSDKSELEFCIGQGLPEELTATQSASEFLTYIKDMKVGNILSIHDTCYEVLNSEQPHGLVLMTYELDKLLDFNASSKHPRELNHLFSFVSFGTGKILHLLTTLDIPKYEFLFYPNSAVERQRISRKAVSNRKLFEKMEVKESAIVNSYIIHTILEKQSKKN